RSSATMPGATCFKRNTSTPPVLDDDRAAGDRRQLTERHEQDAVDETRGQVGERLALHPANEPCPRARRHSPGPRPSRWRRLAARTTAPPPLRAPLLRPAILQLGGNPPSTFVARRPWPSTPGRPTPTAQRSRRATSNQPPDCAPP